MKNNSRKNSVMIGEEKRISIGSDMDGATEQTENEYAEFTNVSGSTANQTKSENRVLIFKSWPWTWRLDKMPEGTWRDTLVEECLCVECNICRGDFLRKGCQRTIVSLVAV
jgi:hypothetical protein